MDGGCLVLPILTGNDTLFKWMKIKLTWWIKGARNLMGMGVERTRWLWYL